VNAPSRAINPWIVAVAVIVPTFMEVLDTTVANVALSHIAGGLSAAATDSEWVITSYLAANAIILPITGWLASHFGRRRYFLFSIAVFTASSLLCGLATNLGMLIFFRAMQGLAGGGLQPCSQGILLDTFPAEKQGSAQTAFGLAALLAPVVGPTLGGYLTDQYSWRWIFYVNVPVGIAAFFFCAAVVHDPAYLQKELAALKNKVFRFDNIGLGLLVIMIVAWEILLSKGQEWDWLGDPFGRIQVLGVLFVLGLVGLVYWELKQERPIVNFRVLLDRNFAIACVTIFLSYAILYGSSTQLPALLETLFGYDTYHAGLVLSPSGFFALLAIIVSGRLLGRGLDGRWLIGGGLLVMASSGFWMSRMNLDIAPGQVIWPRNVLILGLGMVFAPLNVAAYLYIPRNLRGAAVGLLALLRNEGGSFGTSMAQTLVERREQFHTLRLNENLDTLNPAVTSFTDQTQPGLLQLTGDPVAAQQMTLQALQNTRDQQALALSYFDCFWIFGVAGVLLALLVPLMRRSVVEKGANLASE
jgi:MFS transporter, DHA2 family, multidrug resistance protein